MEDSFVKSKNQLSYDIAASCRNAAQRRQTSQDNHSSWRFLYQTNNHVDKYAAKGREKIQVDPHGHSDIFAGL